MLPAGRLPPRPMTSTVSKSRRRPSVLTAMPDDDAIERRSTPAAKRPARGVSTKRALDRPEKKPAGKADRSTPAGTGKAPKPAKPVLLAGGNPQIAKADGDAPVQAYIAAMPGWKSGIGRRLDALITRHVPSVRKAVKWNSPFYGVEGQGWFLSFHVFSRYVKVTFFKGTALRPAPGGGTSEEARWIDVHEDDFDEAQMAEWIRQAAAMPGWGQS
jgi:hypothetical protein